MGHKAFGASIQSSVDTSGMKATIQNGQTKQLAVAGIFAKMGNISMTQTVQSAETGALAGTSSLRPPATRSRSRK